jgi:hypothetical protein
MLHLLHRYLYQVHKCQIPFRFLSHSMFLNVFFSLFWRFLFFETCYEIASFLVNSNWSLGSPFETVNDWRYCSWFYKPLICANKLNVFSYHNIVGCCIGALTNLQNWKITYIAPRSLSCSRQPPFPTGKLRSSSEAVQGVTTIFQYLLWPDLKKSSKNWLVCPL